MTTNVPKLPDHIRQYFESLLAHVLPEAVSAQPQRPLRAADYIRVSTGEQVTEGHGMDTQPANTGDLIRRRGWVHVGTFSDPATSGRTHRRRGLQNLLRYVEMGLIDVVVIDRIDRLYRNLHKLLETVKFLNDHGVRLVSVAEGIDFQTPWGKLVLYVLGALAEIYVDLLSRETSQGKRTRARDGLHNGSPPFGYCSGRCSSCTDPNGEGYCPCYGGPDRNQGRTLIPHPIESAAVETMFELYETGRYTDAGIADEINRRRFTLPDGQQIPFRTKFAGRAYQANSAKAPAQGPGPFNKDAVRALLRRPFYAGVVTYQGQDNAGHKRRTPVEVSQGQHEPLVEWERWERCQEIRRLRSHAPQGGEKRRASTIYLLSQRGRCARCGGPFRWHNTSSGRYGFCVNSRGPSPTCDQRTVRADRVEAELAGCLTRLTLPVEWQQKVLGQLEPEGEEKLDRRLRAADAEWEQAQTAYKQGRLDWGEYLEAERHHRRVVAQIRARQALSVLVSHARELLADFGSLWQQASPSDRRGLVELIVESVTFDNGAIAEIRYYAPFDRLLE